MLFACKVNVRGMCVNKMDMRLSVLWSSALWVPFWLCLSNLNPWDLVTVLLPPPLATILWHASNPYPHSFFTHLPHPFPFRLSPSPFHSLHNSQLLSFVLCWTQLTVIATALLHVFSHGTYIHTFYLKLN